MLLEKGTDSLDNRICTGFDMSDIDLPSLQGYRQLFQRNNPSHPFNELDDFTFLDYLGGYKKDRSTGKSGLTLTGLLMFGKLNSILDEVPHYIVDYRQTDRNSEDSRWIDRITTDYTWSGNLYTFCQLVLRKLRLNVKIPFKLNEAVRVDEPPHLEALREALVNTIIHANYGLTTAVLIINSPTEISFINPGTLRIPKERAIKGGNASSDCRNRNLQKMFQLIGFAEQAGSGFPKIFRGWRSQDWIAPEFYEDLELQQTVLTLRMTSLFPEEILNQIRKRFSNRFEQLSQLERLIVVTAFSEGKINNARISEISKAHQTEISISLKNIVDQNFLVSSGYGRGRTYSPPSSKEAQDITTTEKIYDNSFTDAKLQKQCLEILSKHELSKAELTTRLNLRNKAELTRKVLNPLIENKLIEPTYPDKKTSPHQKYRLTTNPKKQA